jgi:hypothetical protein
MWKLNEMHILTACFITTLAIDLYEHGSLACCQDRYLVDIAMLCAKLLFKKKKSVIPARWHHISSCKSEQGNVTQNVLAFSHQTV